MWRIAHLLINYTSVRWRNQCNFILLINLKRSSSQKMTERIAVVIVISLNLLLIASSIEINLNKGWQIKNANGSKYWNQIVLTELVTLPSIQGIELKNQNVPSGVYSALEEANVTDSILDSYNDVNLRWIGKDNWTYTLVFDGKIGWKVLNIFLN